jgi:hypothetical protein
MKTEYNRILRTRENLSALFPNWNFLSLEEFDKLTNERKKQLFNNRIAELQAFFVVDKSNPNRSYKTIKTAHQFIMRFFTYTPDEDMFQKADFWDTEGLAKLLICGFIKDDCDGAGYPILELLYRVFLFAKKDLYRVACGTETNEGHFVAWARGSDGYLYQVENRLQEPKSVKFMRNKGYEFWDYSPMTRVDRWFKAESFVSKEIYKTPNDLASDKPKFTLSKAFRIDKSKTLIKNWASVAIGSTVTIVSQNSRDIVDTLQANESNISKFLDPSTLGIIMTILGLTGVFLRTVTNKDVDEKKEY